MIERAISQQTPEAMTSGQSWRNSRPSPASTAAESIHNWAMFIIISSARRACHIAVRPRGWRVGVLYVRVSGLFILNLAAADLASDGKYLAVVQL